jgi:membrane-bound inhibitor of C-type lysozyme
MSGRLLLSAGLLALGACATTGEPVRTVSYHCDRGPALTIEYKGDTARIISADGRGVIMPQRETGSGFLYQSATHSIRGKGDELTYTIGRMAPMNCRVR